MPRPRTTYTAEYKLAVAFARKLCARHERIVDLSIGPWTNAHARRLGKRLREYGGQLLTFVEFEDVPSDNNHAERTLRPAVLMRKASYGNQSEQGAHTWSVYRTLKQRDLDPLDVTVAALRVYA